MIEIRNLSLPLSGCLTPDEPYDAARLLESVCRVLSVPRHAVSSCHVAKRSLDARKRSDIHYVALVRVELASGTDEREVVDRIGKRDVVLHEPVAYKPPVPSSSWEGCRPVVVGAGAAGLFCALALAQAGARPILFERGRDALTRTRDISSFITTGVLDESSNIQFGAGGAGTFSDGKLTTGTKSPANAWVLQTFVEAGAPKDILWQGHPHIGSDYLPHVVNNIVAGIESAGGEVVWGARAVGLDVSNGRVSSVEIERTQGSASNASPERTRYDCDRLVLATGHSARDVYELLFESGVLLQPKVFSVGARIEHLQASIDRARYGTMAGLTCLPPADYKLSWHDSDGRGVYTFCMCPGGTVVAAASELGGVVTNGMSEYARDGLNANAALLVNVYPDDVAASDSDPLAGVRFQRSLEKRAFDLGGGDYVAPAQTLADFMRGQASTSPGSVMPTYPRGVSWCDLHSCLPQFVTGPMAAGIGRMAHQLPGFDAKDAVLTGVESRSSSPVRIVRGQNLESISTCGLYPCGEGAGYAGGIMSAAVDGLRVAHAVLGCEPL